jgi:hypothetical protein
VAITVRFQARLKFARAEQRDELTQVADDQVRGGGAELVVVVVAVGQRDGERSGLPGREGVVGGVADIGDVAG